MNGIVLGIRSDKPEAELYLYNKDTLADAYTWEAHRQLSDTLLIKIEDLLTRHNYELKNLKGIVVYQGPGSFTGLRIGISVANTLAHALNVPIVGASGNEWQKQALRDLKSTAKNVFVMPEYGSEAHITAPRK